MALRLLYCQILLLIAICNRSRKKCKFVLQIIATAGPARTMDHISLPAPIAQSYANGPVDESIVPVDQEIDISPEHIFISIQ